jgi:uncharacterized protein
MTNIIDAYCTPGTEREMRLPPEALRQMMDDAGIARAVVAPEDREIAMANASGNRRIIELARRWPERFIPACTVNPWSGEDGCRELRRAVAEGARVLVLAPALQGFCFGDELVDDLLWVAGELRVPVYVHTGPHSFGGPTQVVVAAAGHPEVRFILGHCGSTDYAHDMPAVIRVAPQNIWFELSLVRPWAAAGYVKAGDRSRFLFGSAAPRNDPACELRHLSTFLPIEEYPDVYGGNLAALVAEGLS